MEYEVEAEPEQKPNMRHPFQYHTARQKQQP
jgi:hypothetical protein